MTAKMLKVLRLRHGKRGVKLMNIDGCGAGL